MLFLINLFFSLVLENLEFSRPEKSMIYFYYKIINSKMTFGKFLPLSPFICNIIINSYSLFYFIKFICLSFMQKLIIYTTIDRNEINRNATIFTIMFSIRKLWENVFSLIFSVFILWREKILPSLNKYLIFLQSI